MKKIYIALILGIFLLSFVSATLEVKFIEPLDPLVDFTVTPVSGGSQTAGTYDFVAIVTDEKGSFRFGATPESTPIYANNIVLDGTQGVLFNVTWNATSHPSGYQVYFWYKLSSSNWGVITSLVLGNASYSYTHITNPETTVYYSHFSRSPYFISISITGGEPFDFPKDRGAGVIEINGSLGTTDLRTVFNLMETEGLANTDIARWNNYNQFEGLWGLRIVDGTTGTLTINGMNLWVLGLDLGIHVTDGRNYNVKMVSNSNGDTHISVPFYAGSATFIYFYNTYAEGITLQGGTYGYVGSGWGSTQIRLYNTVLKNSRIHMIFPRVDNGMINTYQDTVIYATQLMFIQNSEDYVSSLTLYGVLRFGYQQYNQRIEEIKLYSSNGAYDVDARCTAVIPKNSKLKDSMFYYYDSSTREILYSQDYPFNIYWRNLATCTDRTIDIEHTFDLVVVDEDGNGIDNVSVKIYDKDNTLIHDILTEAQGNLSQIIITKNLNSIGIVDGTGHTEVVENYPFTIEISKENYETYTVTGFNITEKINWVISLEDRTWNYSTQLKWLVRNDTNTYLKLDEDGNLAIRGNLFENTNSSFINNLPNVAFKIPGYLALTRTGALYLLGELVEAII